MVQRLIVVSLFVLSAVACVAQKVNGEATYISFSIPKVDGTYPTSINASMTVTGYYYIFPAGNRGFVREADGTILQFNVSGAIWTQPESINEAGDITGFYETKPGVPQGFLRHANGKIVTFDVPSAQSQNAAQAQPLSINEFDDIAGNFPFPNVAPSAFTRSSGGVFNIISADEGADYSTVATSINDNGSVVGYFDYSPGERGFVSHPDGYFAEIVVPVTEVNCVNSDTIPEAINTAGTIAGWYLFYSDQCETKNTGGFVLSPEGVLTSFTLPGTLPTLPLPGFPPEANQSLTVPHWISLDENGDVAGSYIDAGGVQHGFVRNPYGTITTFDPPEGEQTVSTSINALGDVAGYYSYRSGSGPPIGFIRIPKS